MKNKLNDVIFNFKELHSKVFLQDSNSRVWLIISVQNKNKNPQKGVFD